MAISAANVCSQDDADVEESWSAPGDHEDACKILEGWCPTVHAIVRMTPPECLVDWKLVSSVAEIWTDEQD